MLINACRGAGFPVRVNEFSLRRPAKFDNCLAVYGGCGFDDLARKVTFDPSQIAIKSDFPGGESGS